VLPKTNIPTAIISERVVNSSWGDVYFKNTNLGSTIIKMFYNFVRRKFQNSLHGLYMNIWWISQKYPFIICVETFVYFHFAIPNLQAITFINFILLSKMCNWLHVYFNFTVKTCR
jgi:hypothetical protein